MPFQNIPFERLRVPILQQDLPCCRLVTMSGEILTIDKSHNKKPDGLFPNDESKCKGKGKGKVRLKVKVKQSLYRPGVAQRVPGN